MCIGLAAIVIFLCSFDWLPSCVHVYLAPDTISTWLFTCKMLSNVRIVSAEDVRRVLTYDALVPLMAAALQRFSQGNAVQVAKHVSSTSFPFISML